MALDHYVPQVHLRRFLTSPGGRLNAIRKTDASTFSPRTQDVCRVQEGNTNPYLQDQRAIEEFLKSVEPRYNGAVDRLRSGATDEADLTVVASFIAYIATCSPAAMRITSAPLRSVVENTAAIMEAAGKLPPAPDVLGGAKLTDLLRDGTVQIEVDPKFPQSFGITQVQQLAATFQTFSWELLHNTCATSPFLTSDFPVAIEPTADPMLIGRLVPLAPDLAVRLTPRLSRGANTGRRYHRSVAHEEVTKLNKTIVRCAEDTVFYTDAASWAPKVVRRNREFRVMAFSRTIPTERGSLMWTSLSVASMSCES